MLQIRNLIVLLFTTSCFAANCSISEDVRITFYGYPDNDPPGPGISCEIDFRPACNPDYTTCLGSTPNSTPPGPGDRYRNCGPRGETAGGTGTFNDPVSMASSGTWFCKQEVVYLPYLRKYLRYEDYCEQCIRDAPRGIKHIDIWTGSTSINGGNMQVECENRLTPSGQRPMIRNPPPDLPVDASPLFEVVDSTTGRCNGTIVRGQVGPSRPNRENAANRFASDHLAALSIIICLVTTIYIV